MSHNTSVLSITLNPALDLTGQLEQLKIGKVNSITEANLHPAGKGVNVAKVLAELGAKVTVSGFLGLENASAFEHLFESQGINDEFIRVAGTTRTNVKIVEANGEVSDLNFPGFSVDAADIASFEQKLLELCQHHSYVVFAGSLAKGVSPEQLADWIRLAKAQGCTVLVDTSGAALAAAIKAQPSMIKPNQDELEELFQQQFSSVEAIKQACEDLAKQDIQHIVLSRGEQGSLWLHQQQWLQAQPPKMKVVSTVGAGDTFVASFCWGLLQQFNATEQLNFATAMSALAVAQANVGLPAAEELERVLQQTTITQH
ncbi:1-phosphofructokinase [Agarivorans gilvus]|uniref:Phosphofructokinase n=1 Tax=Agarivorans gilvus TaxID=680279 RepID=A0ABQ1HWH0_9ALTE|nr:1-phosphofructokinase [Agarivorans gilvus]GGA94569.1 phosphofructokinase [Agarivorans gilvus]